MGKILQIGAGWICDTCERPILTVADGWVEWLASEDEHGATKLTGLRLVHGRDASPRWPIPHGCQYNDRQELKKHQSIVEGLPLDRFTGPDGLVLLLSLIAEHELPTDELLELVKRVQIPGYEDARELFEDAIAEGVVTPSIAEGYYLQCEIHDVLQWAAQAQPSRRSA